MTEEERDALVAQVAKLTQERDEARYQARVHQDNAGIYLSDRKHAESEVTRLTEALKAAERRIKATERELALYKASAEKNNRDANAAESECEALRAEVERLRDRVSELKTHNHQCGERYDAAESRLAAATELLGRAEQALTELGWGGAHRSPTADIRAFLAAQPAAPASYATAAQSTSELMARVHATPARTTSSNT